LKLKNSGHWPEFFAFTGGILSACRMLPICRSKQLNGSIPDASCRRPATSDNRGIFQTIVVAYRIAKIIALLQKVRTT
jgi:hypothetical protein